MAGNILMKRQLSRAVKVKNIPMLRIENNLSVVHLIDDVHLRLW